MYRILIADDEPIERAGLRAIIEKNFENLEIVAEAKNGREAIELFEDLSPDIIFMDIKMPGIDGIQAASEIRQKDEDVKIVILSAYDYFSYAKESIRLNVFEYLLKPVRRKRLLELVENLISALDSEKSKRRENLKLKENMIGMQKVIESRFATLAIEDEKERLEDLNRSSLNFNFDGFYLAGLDISQVKISEDIEYLNNLLFKNFKGKSNAIISPYSNTVFILAEDLKLDHEDIDFILKDIHRDFKNHKNILLSSSVKHLTSIDELKQSMVDMKKKLGAEKKSVISYGLGEKLEICKSILSSSKDVSLQLENMIDFIMKRDSSDMEDFYFEIHELVSSLQYGAYIGRNEFCFSESLDLIKSKKNPLMIKKTIMLEVGNYMHKKGGLENEIIAQIKKHIEENYDKDMRLEDLAYRFSISPYYLSKLFKQETGSNFIEFLTAIRISHAKKMLKKGLPIKSIYKKIGYSDPNYFSRVFKKVTGISPRNFK